MDWSEVARNQVPLAIDDISDQVVLPEAGNDGWFYTPQGRLVQVSDNGSDVIDIAIIDDGYRFTHQLGGDVRLSSVMIGGWSEGTTPYPATQDLSQVVVSNATRSVHVHLISTSTTPSTTKPPLKFLLRLESPTQVVFVELTWTHQLVVSYVHTQGLRNTTAYYLTPRGYCRIVHRGAQPRILTPLGQELTVPFRINYNIYYAYKVNQYGLINGSDNFYVSWDRHLSERTLRGRTRLTGKYLLTLLHRYVDTVAIVNLTTGQVKFTNVDLSVGDYPIIYDQTHRALVMVGIDGLVVQRLGPGLPMHHLSPVLTPTVARGTSTDIQSRAAETLMYIQQDPAVQQRISSRFNNTVVNPRLLPHDIIRSILVDEGFTRLVDSYQWFSESSTLVIIFNVRDQYVPRAFKFTCDG